MLQEINLQKKIINLAKLMEASASKDIRSHTHKEIQIPKTSRQVTAWIFERACVLCLLRLLASAISPMDELVQSLGTSVCLYLSSLLRVVSKNLAMVKRNKTLM